MLAFFSDFVLILGVVPKIQLAKILLLTKALTEFYSLQIIIEF